MMEMVGYGFFQPSTLGMRSQAHALNTNGINVANVNTGGYKSTDTRFETLLSKTLDQQTSDIGGVKPKNYQMIDKQGIIQSTSRDLDLSIGGDGFFQVSPTLNVGNQLFYTRDGSFEIGTTNETSSVMANDGNTITINNGYLVDKNGYYVLGWTPDANGVSPTTGAGAPMRIDAFAFVNQFTATPSANLRLNLPSTTNVGDSALQYGIVAVDSNGNSRTIRLNFHASATENAWTIIPDADNATAIALSGTAFSYATNPTTPSPGTRAIFTKNVGGNDTIDIETNAPSGSSATPMTFTATWSDASTSSFTLDLANTTQFAGDFTPFSYSQNGLASASMSRVQFDGSGHVIGSFEDGTQRKIYKIPLAMFSNPNGLEMKNGMVFQETPESGQPRTVAADVSGVANFNPFAVELSNVDLAGECSRMIMVQNAYNSNATVFRTVDEMTIVARDLKT